MSRHGKRRQQAAHHKLVGATPHKSHLRIVKDEPRHERQVVVGGAAAQRADACLDDRRSGQSPGAMLQHARAAQGLTLDDISRATKISKSVLTAIEAGDVLHLPAGVYTRGFVKSYAAEVGLDPERTAADYFTGIEPLTTHHLLVDDGQLPPLASATPHVDVNDDAREMLAANQMRRFGWLTTAAAAVGLIVYITSFSGRQQDERTAPAGPDPATASSDVARASHDAAPVESALAAAGGPLQMELITDGPCWVVLTVDGQRVFARLLQPGERQTIAVDQHAVMRVGDPGALTLLINGRTGRPLGPAGQPVDVTITKDNFQQFISS